jgi:hypothetical protein
MKLNACQTRLQALDNVQLDLMMPTPKVPLASVRAGRSRRVCGVFTVEALQHNTDCDVGYLPSFQERTSPSVDAPHPTGGWRSDQVKPQLEPLAATGQSEHHDSVSERAGNVG